MKKANMSRQAAWRCSEYLAGITRECGIEGIAYGKDAEQTKVPRTQMEGRVSI